jgi:hypothetical protein
MLKVSLPLTLFDIIDGKEGRNAESFPKRESIVRNFNNVSCKRAGAILVKLICAVSSAQCND